MFAGKARSLPKRRLPGGLALVFPANITQGLFGPVKKKNVLQMQKLKDA
jgi:hypothetical protein